MKDFLLSSDRKPLFGLLPEEVIRMLFEWMDIPSLSILIQTSKTENGSVALLASDNHTWLRLANRRFNIIFASRTNNIMKEPRPKAFGGSDWKAAYRSMFSCNRMPKNRIMPKKNAVFAKGGGGSLRNFSKNKNEITPGASWPKQGGDFIGVWVMVAHTDDCNTRLIQHPMVEVPESRLIELRLCLQNIRSGYGTVDVDVANVSVQIIGSRTDVNALWSSDIVRSGPCRPRILYRNTERVPIKDEKTQYASNMYSRSKLRNGRRALCGGRCLDESPTVLTDSFNDSKELCHLPSVTRLQPFEYIIVSVHVPCTSDMRYETDFLSRALCLHIPTRWNEGADKPMANRPAFDCLASASFMPETEMWDYYMELPGGCLTLADRNRMVSA
mmetsp:Transcript_12596/g.17362  ORF Transcript_12596/g.17362 Transcript_12596/m.17362 type:complete len:386 (-) Transcript_12596:63-1220(-)|eukprot:CAMPEP_0185728196 /NCGR_PEP_ID=MMETSP1171-20130828/3625_1 /TAXON_ID=374046 /ORGANISM="Helicotheca tamensis, Strain CCMP826" /LENGTH=385 /DNA_ID=CAMNT_0028396875 /DNA_START=125 /DNA_END=1282 /DNA_ORIENTATION=-